MFLTEPLKERDLSEAGVPRATPRINELSPYTRVSYVGRTVSSLLDSVAINCHMCTILWDGLSEKEKNDALEPSFAGIHCRFPLFDMVSQFVEFIFGMEDESKIPKQTFDFEVEQGV